MTLFWIIPAVLIISVSILCIKGCNGYISRLTEKWLYRDIFSCPDDQIALIPGAAKLLPGGGINRYYANRISAAAVLFAAGKVRSFLVSGNGRSAAGNEAMDMKDSLIRLGIPGSCITLDKGGYRTLATMVRCRDLFGHRRVMIITQKFHAERAIYIGMRLHMEVTGYCANDPGTLKMKLREPLARIKCIADLARLSICGRLKPPDNPEA